MALVSPIRFEVRPPFGGQDFRQRFTAAIAAAQAARTPMIGPAAVVIDVIGPNTPDRELFQYAEIVTQHLEGLTFYGSAQVAELPVRRTWAHDPVMVVSVAPAVSED